MRSWLMAATAALIAPSALADTLGDALTDAYQHNPTLRAARLESAAADEDTAQARANYLPQVSLEASAGVHRSETNGLRNPRTDPTEVSVIATQPLYTGGLRRAESNLARANVESARENLRSIEQSVLLQVVTVYEDVRRDEEAVRIRQANVQALSRQEQESQARFDVGDVTRTDVAQASARLALSRSGLSQAQAALEGSRARYLQIVGVTAGALEPPPPAPDMPHSLDEAVIQTLSLNPALLEARQGERIAAAQTGIERAALMPQLSAVARADRTTDGAGPGIDVDSTSAAAQVSIPLFEGGFARSRVRQARINEARAAALTEESRRAAIALVAGAWNNYDAARAVETSSQAQLSANELAYRGVLAEREVGLRTTLDVLNAQQELLDAQLAHVSAAHDSYIAAHALLQAIGRLDAGTLAVNAPLYDPDQHARTVRRTLFSTAPADIPLRGREE